MAVGRTTRVTSMTSDSKPGAHAADATKANDGVIVATDDGSLTLRSSRYGETYRSKRGAITEARQVFLEASGVGHRLRAGVACDVLEVGFGVGTTALVTADEAVRAGTRLNLVSIELEPVTTSQLQSCQHERWLAEPLLLPRLLEPWHGQTLQSGSITLSEQPLVTLELRVTDIGDAVLGIEQYDAVYLDGFSHACNPAPWSPAVLKDLHATLRPGGTLVTYSSRGQLQRDLRAAGYSVERLSGPAGKRETVRALKAGCRPVNCPTQPAESLSQDL